MRNELRKVFGKAVLQHEAAKHLSGDEWAIYQKVQGHHADGVRLEMRRFENEYETRFEVERKRIIDQGGRKDLNLVHRWFGKDSLNVGAVDRQADRAVRQEHERLLLKLDAQKEAELAKLFAANERRLGMSNELKQDFEKAADRRSGPDRRRGPRR
jgi:hypothetical protein